MIICLIKLYKQSSANLRAMHTCKHYQQIINQYRIHHKIRVLWPDFQVYDLIQSGIHLTDIRFFTSNSIRIAKINNIKQQLEQVFADKSLTHLAIHKIIELGQSINTSYQFYAILSRRGIAVDELSCIYLRGNYRVYVNIAQMDRQISIWGIQSVTDQIKLIGPKSLSKKSSTWVLQFQSSKPLKSLLFYSTKREPRYGKTSFFQDQLPKDAKLQFCMKARTFPSYLDSLLQKEEQLLFDHFYFSPHTHKPISFKKNEQNKQDKSELPPKAKIQQENIYRQLQQPNQKQERLSAKIMPNSSCLQIINEKYYQTDKTLSQIQTFISHTQAGLGDLIGEQTKQIIAGIKYQEMQLASWDQITNMMRNAHQNKIKQLYQRLSIIRILMFCKDQGKTINEWIILHQNIQMIQEQQLKSKAYEWINSILANHCHQLLNNCDQQIYEQLIPYRKLLTDIIATSLRKHQSQIAKKTDLLYVLMKLHNKRDIFDLYELYRIQSNSLLLTASLRTWQLNNHLYPYHNSDVIYQTKDIPPIISFNNKCTEWRHSNKQFDFSAKFSSQLTSKNTFVSGKVFTVENVNLQCFLFRRQDDFYCFIEQITTSAQSLSQQRFRTYQIFIEMTVHNKTFSQQLVWSFNSPSIAAGSKFTFTETSINTNVECKISFKRNIIHDSILNYFRIRFEELVKLQDKCSSKIQEENKKLVKRRSSVLLQKNLISDFYIKIQRQCFLHKSCNRCQSLSKLSIYQLDGLDFYNLLLFAPFKDQIDALLITLKYLIINQNQMQNHHFWLSHIRIQYLNLAPLLKLINNVQADKQIWKIISSLIDQKIKKNVLTESRIEQSIVFVKPNRCRVGAGMWKYYEEDYCEDYLSYMANNKAKL